MRPLLLLLLLMGCGTGADGFIGGRLRNLCLEAYPSCGTTAGCRLTPDQYVVGSFPGARRVVVTSEAEETAFQVRFFLEDAVSPGSTLQVQVRDADCALDPSRSRFRDEEYDLIAEAGQDGIVILDDLVVEGPGEHLVEIFSDANSRYLVIIEAVSSRNPSDDTDAAP